MLSQRSIWLLPLIIVAGGCARNVATSTSSGTGKLAGTPVGSAEAEAFLKHSMNVYAALKSFKADEAWSLTSTGTTQNLTEERRIAYVSPSKFHLVTRASDGSVLTAVSNGVTMIETMEGAKSVARSCDPPSSLAAADSPQLKNPLFNGSALFPFFGGSDNYDSLVDSTRGGVAFGEDVSEPNGEPARTVTFYGAQGVGNVKAVIGRQSGLVYSIEFDEDGDRQSMLADDPSKNLPFLKVREGFMHIQTNQVLAPTLFVPAPPKGVKLETADNGTKPPVPFGTPAPDAELTGLDGKKVKLSSLRGKIVMIDFWATWCPPCRESLPITDRIYNRFKSQGLEVLAVSGEDWATVSGFVQKNGYRFPTYLDPDNRTGMKFNVDGIPCVVVIDAKGNLSSYSVGLEPEAKLLANLKKAGLKI